MTNGNILIVDDNEEILAALKKLLEEHFTKVHARQNPREALACVHNEDIDVFILDMNFSPGASTGKEGIDLMNAIRRNDPNAVVVLITEWGNAELTYAAIKAGTDNYIQKPWDDVKLLATVRSAMDLSKSRQLVKMLRAQQRSVHMDQHKDYQMVFGKSRVMEDVMRTIDKVADTSDNVFVMGEKGTGKEVLAREIHLRSERKAGNFIKVNFGTLSESMVESELFGHIKGAYTYAHYDKPGSFDLASGGTLFIDEIANIPSTLQVKLLKKLEYNKVSKLESNQIMDIDTRIISATNRYIKKMVIDKTIREDLLDILDGIRIDLPPLRQRMEDLPILIDFFLIRIGEKYQKEIGISKGAIKKLERYHWPGNIRELLFTLEKAVILADHNSLTERDFLFKSRLIPAEGLAMVDLKHNEKEIIKKAIQLNGGNLSKAARHLGISRRTLYNKISRYEI
jgi:DNA-binding NtrC family response regulator